MARDFIGYADTPPDIRWPDGSRIAVNVVVNYEEGSEYSFADGDGRTEWGLTEVSGPRMPDGNQDLAAESMFEYGSRVGFWRLQALLRQREVPATIFASALALERNPRAAAAIAESGWDVVCHGWRWEEHYLLDEATERARIASGYDTISRLIGQPPEGWYCRYAAGVNTRRLVVEHGGFGFDCDAYNDELPYWTEVDGTRHLVVPYSLVTNDAKFMGGSLVTGRQWAEFLIDHLDGLLAADRPAMMSVGLHPRIIGHPARLTGLARFLDHLAVQDGVWLARRTDIARFWRDEVARPAETAP